MAADQNECTLSRLKVVSRKVRNTERVKAKKMSLQSFFQSALFSSILAFKLELM